ncbi:MAG: hypothetical protein WDW38_008582 [Sanguina aurantia]
MSVVARPLVGVGVLIFKGTSVLIGKRKGSHGGGEWALPGGHLEMGETFEQCAAREVEEETGIVLTKLRFETALNSIFSTSVHYVTVFMSADVDESVTARLMEPNKCDGWEWRPWPCTPKPMFLPLELLLSDPAAQRILPRPPL